MTEEEIDFEELQEIVNSPLKNKRTIKDFVKTIFDLSNKNKQLEKENEQLKCDLYNTNANLQHITIEYEEENTELNRNKIELVNSVTELKTKITELEEKLKNNSYVQILQNEKAEMAEDFAKQIEKMKCCVNCSKYHICEKEMNWDKPTENHCEEWEFGR